MQVPGPKKGRNLAPRHAVSFFGSARRRPDCMTGFPAVTGGPGTAPRRGTGKLTPVLVVAVILFVLSAVAVVTGVLGLTGTLPPNRIFGVHTDEAVRTEENYRLANRVAAPASLVAGVLLAAGGGVAVVAGGLPALIISVLTLVIAVFTLGAGATAAANALAANAPAPEVGGCGSACGSCSLRDACAPAAN